MQLYCKYLNEYHIKENGTIHIIASIEELFFDEECFIRQQDQVGRFKVDNLAPIAGKGVVANSADNGKTIASPQVTLEALTKRVTFL